MRAELAVAALPLINNCVEYRPLLLLLGDCVAALFARSPVAEVTSGDRCRLNFLPAYAAFDLVCLSHFPLSRRPCVFESHTLGIVDQRGSPQL